MKRRRKFRLKLDRKLLGKMLLAACVEPAVDLLQSDHLRLPGPIVAALLRVRAAQFEAGDAEVEARVVAAELLMHHNLALSEAGP